MRRIYCLLLSMALIFSLAACSSPAETNEATTPAASTAEKKETESGSTSNQSTAADTTAASSGEAVKDTEGTEFQLPMKLDRIIVLNSNCYELICVLGMEDKVIGVADTVTFPASAESKDKYGKWTEPNAELIIEAKPDAVFVYGSSIDPAIRKQIEDAGITTIALDFYRLHDIPTEVVALGKMLGAEEKAKDYVAFINKYCDMIEERTANVEKVKVYYEGYTDYKTAGQGSGAYELLDLAGVQNLAADLTESSPEISDEWVLEQNPDMIVKNCSSTKMILGQGVVDTAAAQEYYQTLVSRPGWDGTNAVKNQKVMMIASRIGTSPQGLVVGSLYIAKMAYPDLFADIDPAEVHKELMDTYYGGGADEGIWYYDGK